MIDRWGGSWILANFLKDPSFGCLLVIQPFLGPCQLPDFVGTWTIQQTGRRGASKRPSSQWCPVTTLIFWNYTSPFVSGFFLFIVLLYFICWERLWRILLPVYPVADPGFPRGRQLLTALRQPVILQNVCRKLHEHKWRILDRRGPCPFPPPMGSTTAAVKMFEWIFKLYWSPWTFSKIFYQVQSVIFLSRERLNFFFKNNHYETIYGPVRTVCTSVRKSHNVQSSFPTMHKDDDYANVGISEWLLMDILIGFFTNSPQYKNANIPNFGFSCAMRKELDQWSQ